MDSKNGEHDSPDVVDTCARRFGKHSGEGDARVEDVPSSIKTRSTSSAICSAKHVAKYKLPISQHQQRHATTLKKTHTTRRDRSVRKLVPRMRILFLDPLKDLAVHVERSLELVRRCRMGLAKGKGMKRRETYCHRGIDRGRRLLIRRRRRRIRVVLIGVYGRTGGVLRCCLREKGRQSGS
jgi:hypothetical protein